MENNKLLTKRSKSAMLYGQAFSLSISKISEVAMTETRVIVATTTQHFVCLERLDCYLVYDFNSPGAYGKGSTIQEALGQLLIHDRYGAAYVRVKYHADTVGGINAFERGRVVLNNLAESGVRITYR